MRTSGLHAALSARQISRCGSSMLKTSFRVRMFHTRALFMTPRTERLGICQGHQESA